MSDKAVTLKETQALSVFERLQRMSDQAREFGGGSASYAALPDLIEEALAALSSSPISPQAPKQDHFENQAKKGEQSTICEACGNSNLAANKAVYTDDETAFCPRCAPASVDQVGESGGAALEKFTEYFVRNYPGPDTIIFDPKWHAPRIFRAVLATLPDQAALVKERDELKLFSDGLAIQLRDTTRRLLGENTRSEKAEAERDSAVAALREAESFIATHSERSAADADELLTTIRNLTSGEAPVQDQDGWNDAIEACCERLEAEAEVYNPDHYLTYAQDWLRELKREGSAR